MSWRKWLIRLLVFGVLVGAAFAVALYQRWTDPAVVRQQVIDRLKELFPGASVSLESARLRILGGIVLNELRIVRGDDPDRHDILHVPSAVVYHDKEHLLDGKIAFRKVELHRPRLRLQRNRDGRWNVDDLTGPGPAGREQLPTLVIYQGTFILDDRLAQPGTPPVEVSDIHLTLINDPLLTVTWEGKGTSEALGALQLRGSWQRDTNVLGLSAQASGVPLSPQLVQRLAACCPDRKLTPFPLEGQADLKAELSCQPGGSVPFSYDVRCQLRQVKVNHPQLPMALEGLEASLRCTDGRLTVERLTAFSDKKARVDVLKATALLPRPEETFEAVVMVKHLPLEPELFRRLPQGIQDLAALFQPAGKTGVKVQARRERGRWIEQRCTMYPEGIAACYEHFKYPAEGITGTVDYDALQGLTHVDVRGYASGQPGTMKGYWKGGWTNANAKLDIHIAGLPLDDTLIKALPDGVKGTAKSFNATGRCNAQARIVATPNVEGVQCTYHAQFFDSTVRWDGFRYPLENVTGFLDIYPDYWQGRDFRGTHRGGEVVVQGRTYPVVKGQEHLEPRMVIDISAKNVALDGDLKEALKTRPALLNVWDTFSPTGRLNCSARIDRLPGQPEHDMDVTLDVHGCSVVPSFFRYTLNELTGTFRYHKDRVEVSRVTARHGATRLSLDKGTVELYANGGYFADLTDLRGNPVLPDSDLLTALPEALRSACQGVNLKDPFAVRTRLVVAQAPETGSPTDIYWDGQLWLRDAKLQIGVDAEALTGTVACVGRYNGRQLLGLTGNVMLDRVTLLNQPFRDVHARLLVRESAPDVLAVGLRAPAFNGEVSGQARIEFRSDLHYELNLTASQIRLEEFGKHNFGAKSELTGIGAARLYLTGQGSGVDSLEGNGTIDVPYTTLTRLYNLPLLLDLIKFLGLRWPDRTAFEEAHAQFSIHGPRVNFSQLELLGNVVSLYGYGGVNLDGTDVQLDFYPSWARVEQVLPPVIRSIPPAISKNLLKIEVRGKVTGKADDVRFHKKPIPVLLDPLLQMRDWMVGRKNSERGQ
ncbi:MAG: hypothetical protein L0Z62_22010 [Gemmataceae bacterium]|nr:hypothetical protein [Gemmataceae bacterium]